MKLRLVDSILNITEKGYVWGKEYGMAKKIQDLKPDTVLKNYWRNNEQFADFFNAVLFKGKQVIKPEELEDADTEESSILEHREYAENISASRDNIKIRKKSTGYGAEFVMLGIEGQEHIHYAMPMRIMGYDYGIYKKQYDSNAGKYKSAEDLDEDEYLSRMKRTDKFIPVVTVVVYYGEKPWDGATALHGMLDIPKELAEYVNDYRMLLVEARKNNLTLHNANNVDLFNLLEIVLDKSSSANKTRDRVIEYAREHKVEKSVVMTVAGAANCRIDYNALDRKGDADMCTVFEATREEGRTEGRMEGRMEGRAEGIIEAGYEIGLPENNIIKMLQDKLDISLQTAQEYLERFRKQME